MLNSFVFIFFEACARVKSTLDAALVICPSKSFNMITTMTNAAT
jgi:16S rRNA C1402 (ribose-2'-O) methylase RsmI